MKKLFSLSPETKKSWGVRLWFVFHLSIPLLLVFSVFFIGPVRVNTLLMDMLPQSGHSKEIAKADSILGERSGRETVILAAARDFEIAKNGATLLYKEFEHSPAIEEISLYFDSSTIVRIMEYLHKYRFVIASRETRHLLETGMAEEIAWDALASAYGAFNFFSLDSIDKDPFLLAERQMETFIFTALSSGGNLGLKDDVLAANIDDVWYVLLRMRFTPLGVSLNEKNAIGGIYSTAEAIKKTVPELDFYFSGIPFHSYESSSGAQKEVAIIGTITLSIILIIFLLVFRSPIPVVFSILDALISIGLATASAFLIFREIHILTFVFGTTLIGSCVDYSIHFFIHWKGNTNLKNGNEIRSYIKKSIIMCFVSTLICYIAFLFTPFTILRQFAVFSITGLSSSFLTAYCIYPLLSMHSEEKRSLKFIDSKFFIRLKNYFMPPVFRYISITVIIVLAIIIISIKGLKIDNDIRSFYTMSPSMMTSEIKTAIVMDHGSAPWYFIVSGNSPDETLQHEEILIQKLKEEVSKGNLRSFLGTSVFIPSVKTQKETYEAMKALLPLASSQYEYLGFPPEYAEIYYEEFVAGENYCLPEDAPGEVGISNLWIGKSGDHYYSCVMLLHPKNDEEIFLSIAGELGFVHLINKAKDISNDLDTLTKTIMLFFAVAFIVVSILVFFAYPLKDSLKICTVPVFLFLSAIAALAVRNIPLSFFSIAAIILIFGLGLDYIFYITGAKNKDNKHLASFAVSLSFFTTLLSFGALAFSGFMPVHTFGFTVSIGLIAAFISTILLQGREG